MIVNKYKYYEHKVIKHSLKPEDMGGKFNN